MTNWTLGEAKNGFSELVRRALAHQPQVVVRGGRDAVVVVALEDYSRLAAPRAIVEFFKDSPLAAAMNRGELSPDAFDRDLDPGRDVAF